MRHTALSRGAARLVIRTGDAGTEVTDAAGQALAQHGTDRHDELLDRLAGEGWAIAADGTIRPPEASPAPPTPGAAPEAGPADGGPQTDPGPSS